MRVAIDVSPIKSGHKARGIGSYTKNLVEEFKKRTGGIEFEFFENPASPPPVDIIHYPYFDLFFHTLPIFKKSSRVVVTIHDVIPLVFPKHFLRGVKGSISLFLQRLALKNVDAVICDSNTSKKDIVQKLSYPSDKIHVVYLAPGENFKNIQDKKRLSKIATKYRLPVKFALYVGDVNWNKNILGLLEAVKIAKANLVMVGDSIVDHNLPQVKQIDAKISSLNIKDKVIRTGYVEDEDLVAIYNLAPLTVLPSFYEGFGLPVLESMACATSVVGSKLASIPEISGNAAIYCNPSDPKDIASKISYVLGLDTKSKEKLKSKSIKQAAKFKWSKTAQDTIKIYKLLHES